jgi:aconitate hydratase
LIAQKANALGLTRKPWVKSSFAPGSKVAKLYLEEAGLLAEMEKLGFGIVAYACTTCNGMSGALDPKIQQEIIERDLYSTAVLSGNRNFDGRIHPYAKQAFLASPPLVVAYAIAGTVDIDLATEPLGLDADGQEVFLRDLWPSETEIQEAVSASLDRDQFIEQYANVLEGSDEWRDIKTAGGAIFEWPPASTYIQEPPFFVEMPVEPGAIESITGARCLIKVGDSVTTDHISPAGAIMLDSPAGRYLIDNGVSRTMFNSYGSRRGNDRVMTRGTFANVRVRNQLAPDTEGGWTTYFGNGEVMAVYDAAMRYRDDGVPLVVLAGKDYGMGSSRDWAAKGTLLLGARAVIAESFERIHRSNLVGMGVLPLCFEPGSSPATLGLDGTEVYDIEVPADLQPRAEIRVKATPTTGGESIEFTTLCRIDTPVEVEYYRNGGILHTVLRRMAAT